VVGAVTYHCCRLFSACLRCLWQMMRFHEKQRDFDLQSDMSGRIETLAFGFQ